MKVIRRVRSVFALILALSLVVAACTDASVDTTSAVGSTTVPSPEPTGEPTDEPTQTTQSSGEQPDPDTELPNEIRISTGNMGAEALDPILGSNSDTAHLWLIYDPLVGTNAEGTEISKETGLASDWDVSEDGLTYTFTLREGVQFHNGDEVTSEDVKFTLERLALPQARTTEGKVISGQIENITTPGPYEVVVELNEVDPLFLVRLSPLFDLSSFVVPKTHIEEVGEEAFSQNPIGSGPYRFVERQVGAFIKYEAATDDHFAVGTPRYEAVTVSLVPEESTRIAQLIAGDTDLVDVTLQQVGGILENGLEVFESDAADNVLLVFQLQQNSATADINLRKAMSYAMNRAEMNEFLLGGLADISGNIFIGQLGSEPIEADPYDPDAAREFLNQTPYGEGGEPLSVFLQVQVSQGWPTLRIAEAVHGYWRDIGIDAQITYREYGAFRQEWGDHTLPEPAAMIIPFTGRVDWSGSVTAVFTCDGVLASACDAQLDQLTQEWTTAEDEEEYRAGARAVEQYMSENYIAVPLFNAPIFRAGSEAVPDDFSPGAIAGAYNIRSLIWQSGGS